MRFTEPALQRAGFICTIVETFRQGRPASQSGERYGRADTRQGRERMKAVALKARRGKRPMSGAGLRHLARAITWAESATPEVGEDTMARETSRAVFACVSILLVAAVAGCSDFSLWGKPDKPIDPNVYPENYKKDVLAYLKAHPAEMLNVREASISAPALRQFGSENRFFACPARQRPGLAQGQDGDLLLRRDQSIHRRGGRPMRRRPVSAVPRAGGADHPNEGKEMR